MAAGFAAAILCLGVTVAVTTWLEALRDEQARLVQHTTETLRSMESLESAFLVSATSLDAHLELGAAWEQRLTGEAEARVEPLLAQLRGLLSDEPAQLERLARLEPLVRSVAPQGEAAREAMASGQTARAWALLEALGPTTLAPAAPLFRALVEAETSALAARQQAWRRASITGAVVFGLATAALAILMALAARLVRHEIASRERLSTERAEMLALQQQLMAIVSHDLRNPLAAMKSGAALLARNEAIDDDSREDAGRVVSNARRMERLIRDLLDFSRLRAGQPLPLTPDQADLVEVCRQAVSDLGREAEGRVTVEGRGDVEGAWDRDRVEQVVANLVTNALKYGPPQRPIRVEVEGLDGEVRLSVRDEGGALAPALHQAIFEPFRRGVSGDAAQGRSAGLGLYIVRRIAEAHGGSATVASEPASGTTFTVTLPRRPAPGAGPAAAGG